MTSEHGTGACPRCETWRWLRADGRLPKHWLDRRGGVLCPGSGEKPSAVQPVEALP